ncbi:MAG TPA: hypothetical protein VG986_12755 [Pseudolabrys sp.]|nr:hypothetical protein [Pseudolabrys sp.]
MNRPITWAISAGLLLAGLAVLSQPAQAENYPTRPHATTRPSVDKQIGTLGLVPHDICGPEMKQRVAKQISTWHEAIVKAGIERK